MRQLRQGMVVQGNVWQDRLQSMVRYGTVRYMPVLVGKVVIAAEIIVQSIKCINAESGQLRQKLSLFFSNNNHIVLYKSVSVIPFHHLPHFSRFSFLHFILLYFLLISHSFTAVLSGDSISITAPVLTVQETRRDILARLSMYCHNVPLRRCLSLWSRLDSYELYFFHN